MSRLRNLLALLSLGMLVWAAPAMAQVSPSPKPPPFRPPGPRPNAPSPKPPPFRPKPPFVQPIPPVIVAPGNPGNVKPPPEDEQQRRRRLFFILMLRQQALTRAALQQAALATAFANQLPYQSAIPSYSMQMYPYPSPSTYPPSPAPMAKDQAPAAELALLAGIVGVDGKIAWPLGLQIARPALETRTMRERIDGLVRMAAKQAAYGQVQRGILDEAKQLLADLRKAFENSRQDMPERTARDADAFLARLDSSLQSMQGGALAAPNDGAGKKKY